MTLAAAGGPPVRCAWCDRGLAAGDGEGPVSHGMCLPCAVDTGTFTVESLPGMDPRQADALPFGLLRLDTAGHVLDVNGAETRLAGRRADAYLGRSFFEEIAPCTSVREFRGVYDRMVATGDTGPHHLVFLFEFPSRACLVEILLAWEPHDGIGSVVVRPIT